MTSEIKKLGSDTILYGMGTILPRVINSILVPFQTRVFPKEDYGEISELYGYVAFFNIIFLFGMETTFFRFANKPGHDPDRIFRATQTVVLTISLLVTALLLIFQNQISAAFSISNPNLVSWIALIILIDAVVAIPFARLRLRNKPFQFSLYKVLNISVLVGLNVYLLVYAGFPSPGIELVFLANLLANALFLIFFFKDLISWRPLIDKAVLPDLLSYSFPIVVTGLAGMTNEMFSRIAIDNWLPQNFYPGKSPEYIQGVFSACYKFSIFMSIAVQAFRFAAEPFFFSKASDKNSPALFAKVNHYFVLFASAIMIVICLNLDWLKYFVDPESWAGLIMVPFLLLGYLFLGVYFNVSIWFKVTDKTYFGTIIAIVGAVLTVGLNYLLIPVYGIIGSSLVTLICYFTMTALGYGFGQRYYPIPYTVGKDLAIITIACLLVFINTKIVIDNVILSIGTRGLVSLVVLWITYRLTFRKSDSINA